MAYVAYSGLTTPNEVLEKIKEYIQTRGYSIIQDITDDLNIYDMASTDGKRFVFLDRTGEYFIVLRSANGTMIFGTNDDPAMDLTSPDTNADYTGIGMVVSEGYSKTQRWYNQYRAPKKYKDKDIYGVFMPMKVADGYSYTLYCNNVVDPTDSLVFSLVKENDTYLPCTHLVYANIAKYDTWTGGALFSGSSIKSLMGNDVKVFEHAKDSDKYILPILSSGVESNTFLRIDIDEAPTEIRGEILWASSGTKNETGKKLSMPIRTADGMNGKIPNYWWLQSKGRLDWGRNVNTLNCITIDMPLFVSVLVDPDVLDNYAAVGHIIGIYYVSTLNMQTAGVYERSYPKSNDLCQVFPHGKRRGVYGFDGISIQQNDFD